MSMYKGVFLSRTSSCSGRTANDMPTVDRAGRKAALFLAECSCVLAVVAEVGCNSAFFAWVTGQMPL